MSDATCHHTANEDDPFEAFNRSQGADDVADPYPRFAGMRAERGPIFELLPGDQLGQDAAEFAEGSPQMFMAVSHDAVSEVLRDARRFSSSFYADAMGAVMGHSILGMDPPEHSRHRALLQQAFSKSKLEHWERDLVRPTIDACIDRFADRGRAELVRELTFPFPVAVIAGMIGVPEERNADFHRWAVELISIQVDIQRGMQASQKLRGLFAELLAQRRAEPCDDLMTLLAEADLEGTRLDDEAIYAFMRLLAPAGAETTYRSSSNLLAGLLTHPEQLDALRDDRSLMAAAIEEGLRWECPLTGIVRTANEDTEVCGVRIPATALIHVNLASANRDETRYERADAFDIFRSQKQHMAFAFGPHRCLGMHLATLETRVLLAQLFDRLPGLRLDPDAQPPEIRGLMFRSPRELRVVFDPR